MNHNIKEHFQNKINKWEAWKLGPHSYNGKRKKLQASQIIFLIHDTWQKIIQIKWGNNIWHTSLLENLLLKHGKSSQSIIQEINKHLFYLKMFSKMFTTLLHNSFTLKHLKTKDICNLSGAVKYAPSTRVTSNTVYFQTWLCAAAMPLYTLSVSAKIVSVLLSGPHRKSHCHQSVQQRFSERLKDFVASFGLYYNLIYSG